MRLERLGRKTLAAVPINQAWTMSTLDRRDLPGYAAADGCMSRDKAAVTNESQNTALLALQTWAKLSYGPVDLEELREPTGHFCGVFSGIDGHSRSAYRGPFP
ncbi:hypothetical protein H4S08_002324 [Coemansia sp. RSA 1365]|nr:hypothetical protein H4S08_002324 [Coemansia sp. RSA 1365]